MNNFYRLNNKFEIFKTLLKKENLKNIILDNYYNSLSNSQIYPELISYYYKDYIKSELSNVKTRTKTKHSDDSFKLNNQEKYEVNLSIHNNGYNNIEIPQLLQFIEKNYLNTLYPEFFEIIHNFETFDFEKLMYAPIDLSKPYSRIELFNEENMNLIKDAYSKMLDLKFSQLLDEYNYNGKLYIDKNEINKLSYKIENELNTNSHLIQLFMERLYTYLKTNQLDGSIGILNTILILENKSKQANLLFEEIDQIKQSIYTETRHKILEQLYEDFDERICQVKHSVLDIITDAELNEIFDQNILKFTKNEANDNITYYENGIYKAEAFERIINLAFWNQNLYHFLTIRYKKLYFDLNINLIQ